MWTPRCSSGSRWRIVTGKEAPVRREDAAAAAVAGHHLPVPWVDPSDVAAATLWLLSDAARYVTGAVLPVDAEAIDH